MRRRKQSVPQMIQEMVSRIVRRFDPDRIILFGSRARGNAGPDSDVDMLVIMSVEREAKARKELEIRMAVHAIPVAKDILVSNMAEFEARKDIVGTIAYDASREGKLLYVRTV